MNLWHIFPESLLHIKGILYLPYLAIMFYSYVIYQMVRNATHRLALSAFIVLSFLASSIMVVTLGSNIGKIIPPLALFSVMLLPSIMLIVTLKNKDYPAIRLWFITILAGLLHSISWSVWFFVIAGS